MFFPLKRKEKRETLRKKDGSICSKMFELETKCEWNYDGMEIGGVVVGILMQKISTYSF